MVDTARLSINITKDQLDFINSLVDKGGYESKSDVIRDILRTRIKKEKSRQEQIDRFNTRIKKSIKSGLVDVTPEELKAEMATVIEKAAASK